MQENRSFDHYFGNAPSGVRGLLGPRRPPLPRQRQAASRCGTSSGTPPADRGRPQGLPQPFELEQKLRERRLHQRHQPRLGAPAPGLGRREHGRRRAGPLAARRRPQHPPRWATTARRPPLYYAPADAFTICDGYHCRCSARPTPTGSWGCRAASTPPARTADRFSSRRRLAGLGSTAHWTWTTCPSSCSTPA